MIAITSPSLRGRGLKSLPSLTTPALYGRPLCEGVDWNVLRVLIVALIISRPLCEGVDWNYSVFHFYVMTLCRPLCEGVDWNAILIYRLKSVKTSPSLRGRGLKYCSLSVVRVFRRRPLCEGVDWNTNHKPLCNRKCVALFARAWIEMGIKFNMRFVYNVALFARAWIEMPRRKPESHIRTSPSLRGRGLKFVPIHKITYLK